jgi:predicted nucleic acid-binding protein
MLRRHPVVPFDLETAQVHARLWAELSGSGVNIGAHDLIIGATALAHGMRITPRDLRSFPKIPGLEILQW